MEKLSDEERRNREIAKEIEAHMQRVMNPRNYYVPAPPENAADVRAKVDILTKKHVQQIVQSGQTGFTTEGEFVRAATVWFVELIGMKLKHDTLKDSLVMYHKELEMLEAVEQKHNLTRVCEKAGKALKELLSVGMVQDAEELVLKMIAMNFQIHPKFGTRFLAWAMGTHKKLFEGLERGMKKIRCDRCRHPQWEHYSLWQAATCWSDEDCPCETFYMPGTEEY